MDVTAFPWKIMGVTTIFAIAMGFLESSVVVYLRAFLYPDGFTFPLAPMPDLLAITELFRESATIIMLIGIGYLAGKNKITRFAWFLYSFAIWDLFYYVFLKIFLHWPASFLTWDILFLIPLYWVGPVIAPVIVSVTMVASAITMILMDNRKPMVKIRWMEWVLLITGSFILILSFTWDYSSFILEHYSLSNLGTVPSKELINLALKFIPRHFNWFLFILAESLILAGIAKFIFRNSTKIKIR